MKPLTTAFAVLAAGPAFAHHTDIAAGHAVGHEPVLLAVAVIALAAGLAMWRSRRMPGRTA